MLSKVDGDSKAVQASGLHHTLHLSDNKNKPLVLLVHGRAGDENVMWIFTKAFERLKPTVIAPRAFLSDPIGGYSWWHVERGTSQEKRTATWEDVSNAAEKMFGFIQVLPRLYGVDTRQIIAVGFSQGAAVVSALVLKRPELFSGFALLAGFVPQIILEREDAIDPRISSGQLQLPPSFIAHGTEDHVIPVERARQARDYFSASGSRVTYQEESIGHKVGSSGIRALKSWFDELIVGDK